MNTSFFGHRMAVALRLLGVAILSGAALAYAASEGGRPTRLTPEEMSWPAAEGSTQPGASMQGGVQSLVIFGNASKPALYSIMFKVGPNAQIPAHSHPDDRSCFVMAGVWYFGYGDKYSVADLKALPPGSHYTEPAGIHHFAGTRAEGATVECTSVGPSGTTFVNPKDDPRNRP
ncbi:MAG: cupin domain-containing protein [Steroidobacteraceae bacterium]